MSRLGISREGLKWTSLAFAAVAIICAIPITGAVLAEMGHTTLALVILITFGVLLVFGVFVVFAASISEELRR